MVVSLVLEIEGFAPPPHLGDLWMREEAGHEGSDVRLWRLDLRLSFRLWVT